MRLLQRRMSRAEAIAKAIDLSDPGDELTIHSRECTDPNICTCKPVVVYVGTSESRHPMGFRPR